MQTDKQLQESEKGQERLTIENIELKAEIEQLKDKVSRSILKSDFEQMSVERERLLEDLTSTRAAMLSYKKLTETVAEQAKNLKLVHERKKDEHDNLLQALREMQSESVGKDRLGKLYFIIMLSRWQEAAVNKKYCHALNDVRSLRSEFMRSEAHNHELQKSNNQCLEEINERHEANLKLQQKCDELSSTYITHSKADDLYRKYLSLCEDRTDLEIELLKARDVLHEEQDKIQELTVGKLTAEKLLGELKHLTERETCDALISMSEDFKQMKLKEFKLQREHNDMKEKADYYTRLLKQRND